MKRLTREQYDDIEYARSFDMREYHELLEKHTGITAKQYTAFSYYDNAGNYLGDSNDSDTFDLLTAAYVKVEDA